MPPQLKRVQETESSGNTSAPKRIRGSAANWGRAGFEADPVVRSHRSTWQNASLNEPNEDTERYPWKMPTPTVESEPVATPLLVGPIALWRAAMITKYDLMIEFDRDGKNWTIMQRRKHCSVPRMVLRETPVTAKFMLIETDAPNVSTREIIKVSSARAPPASRLVKTR